MRRISAFLVVLSCVLSMGAQHRTPNFLVNAPTADLAKQVGQWAEHYRKEKAIQWVGQEMAAWQQPCPLFIDLNPQEPSGETSFQFTNGNVQILRMIVRGPLDRVLQSVLPHEVTHTVFAFHFRQPVPRWADEGGSVLSEDDLERDRHDKLVRSILNRGQAFRLRTLMSMKEYPAGALVGNLYAQGYSLCDYLVKRSSRPAFLNFVAHALQQGWDNAVQTHFGHRNVEELETAWLDHLKNTKRQAPTVLAANTQGAAPVLPANRSLVRLTVPPAQPLDPQPVARAAMPTPDQMGQQFGSPAASRPGFLPSPQATVMPNWREGSIAQTPAIPLPTIPPTAPQPQQPRVTLGPPQFSNGGQAQPFSPISPVGFPR